MHNTRSKRIESLIYILEISRLKGEIRKKLHKWYKWRRKVREESDDHAHNASGEGVAQPQ